ncbi:MAG: RNA chaperone Hfq [Gracilibacteraceae bacterium]|jgi:host factor-I protein|nr:RNA chaperone Hfq [Gracilibacteraceae bacterium]
MTKSALNLQDSFLNQLRRENVPVTIYLVNGFQLRGLVRGFDNYTVFLEFEGRQQLIFKHAISTIMPNRTISLNFLAGPGGTE